MPVIHRVSRRPPCTFPPASVPRCRRVTWAWGRVCRYSVRVLDDPTPWAVWDRRVRVAWWKGVAWEGIRGTRRSYTARVRRRSAEAEPTSCSAARRFVTREKRCIMISSSSEQGVRLREMGIGASFYLENLYYGSLTAGAQGMSWPTRHTLWVHPCGPAVRLLMGTNPLHTRPNPSLENTGWQPNPAKNFMSEHAPTRPALVGFCWVSMTTLLTGWLREHNNARVRRPARRASMTTLLRQHDLHFGSDKSMISAGRRS
jgi:hypothetical protein